MPNILKRLTWVAILCFCTSFFCSNVFCEPIFAEEFSIASTSECDVVVVGGGTAGVAAAVQCGRADVQTILLEATHQLGGNMTSGGVNFPGLFHAWSKQIISGIGWELVVKTVELNDDTLPDFTKPTGPQHWLHQIRVNAPLFSALAEEAGGEAGVEIRYYESPVQVVRTDDQRWKITTCAQGELKQIICRQMIDCTGNGSLAKLAGAKLLRGEVTQPGTFNYTLEHAIQINRLTSEQKTQIEQKYEEAMRLGTLQTGDARHGILNFLADSQNNYVWEADNSTAMKRTQTNLRGRAAMLRMLRFVRTLPSGETAKLRTMSAEVGVRETYRVVTEYMISAEDYTTGKCWDDSLCFAFYPIDLHINETGVAPAHLKEDVVATVPRRALVVQNVPNCLVAGRCVGSDRLANSALRVQATCFATGQAAGAVAATAVKCDVLPLETNLDDVKTMLRENDAIVP